MPTSPHAAAQVMRELWASKHQDQPIDVHRLALQLGISVSFYPLGAATGGLQAILSPRLTGGFAIVVDPDPAPGPQSTTAIELVHAIRIGHELGHTHFYNPGIPPRYFGKTRITATDPTEEAWCDEFARWLLGCDTTPCSLILQLMSTTQPKER